MCIRYLGFLLLICLPGILHGQSAQQSCTAPNLDGGFFAPKLETYPHGAQLTYTCNSGRVPVVRGWWVTSSCQNGKWSHEPQCIGSTGSGSTVGVTNGGHTTSTQPTGRVSSTTSGSNDRNSQPSFISSKSFIFFAPFTSHVSDLVCIFA
ncbi:uncharacterized protein LOC128368797 isoform X2 [Scomber japonicus]|uniref:uncharacterized protein LOC128368797 isoform X2 n=1 Tax=Scomber japonicus TaxID=13676 RepID=UPI0023056AF8|nr:uncharacterized protein LOC128368797 isoform X2 [Scomber japonicus]